MVSRIGDYKILKKIGKGTYGSVYKALDLHRNVVAIKKLSYNQLKNGVPLNIIREIKFLKGIKHPNIISILDVIVGTESFVSSPKLSPSISPDMTDKTNNSMKQEPRNSSGNRESNSNNTSKNKEKLKKNITDDSAISNSIINEKDADPSFDESDFNICIIFEYFEHDLSGLIMNARSELRRRQTVYIMKRILEALNFLHKECKILHRDLKPSNIFISRRGEVKLGDFGLAKQFDEKIQSYTGNVVTVWYRAPEILNGEKVYDFKIDVWAVGCIFGEILLGKPLFPASNEIRVMQKINHLFEDGNFEELFGGFGDYEMEFLKHLLERDPLKRPSVEEALKHEFFMQEESQIDFSIGESHEMLVRENNKLQN